MKGERIQAKLFVFMYDLKLFSKSEEQIDALARTAHIFSTDIGMEFGMKTCGMLAIKRGKVVRCEGTELPNSTIMKDVKKEGYTYLGTVELDKIKENEMKEKTIKRYNQRLRLEIWSRNTTVEREGIERCGQEIKENNEIVWSVTH